jgi:hypothetical protein
MKFFDYLEVINLMMYFVYGTLSWKMIWDTNHKPVVRGLGLLIFLFSLSNWVVFVAGFIYDLIHLT